MTISKQRAIIYSLPIAAAIIFAITTFLDRALMKTLFANWGYYLMLLLTLFWVIAIFECVRRYKPDLKHFLKKYGLGLIVCLLISVIIFSSVKPIFRVLSDEANLMAVSKCLLYEKKADKISMGKWHYDNFYPIHRYMAKRPLGFPFFTHIIHAVSGYRVENAFVLNGIALFLILFLIYAVIKKNLGALWAISAVILVASQPLVVQTATSAGFDTLATLSAIAIFLILHWFLEKPEPNRFQLLWISLLMHANIRQEGGLISLIILVFLFCMRYIKLGLFKTRTSFIYVFTPFILLLTFWQRVLVTNPYENYGTPAISTKYFIENTLSFFRLLVNYDFYLPYATILNFIGFAAFIYFGYLFLKKAIFTERHKRHLAIITCACLLVNWITYASYFRGQLDHPTNSRYYLLFFTILPVIVVVLANRLEEFKRAPAYLIILSMLTFAIYHPLSVQDRYSRKQTLPRKYRSVMNFLKQEAVKDRNFLVITPRPIHYTIHNYGAVHFKYANKHKSIARGFNNHLFNAIYVVQDIEHKTLEPTEDTRLNERFELKELVVLKNSGRGFTRISKVISIAEDGEEESEYPELFK